VYFKVVKRNRKKLVKLLSWKSVNSPPITTVLLYYYYYYSVVFFDVPNFFLHNFFTHRHERKEVPPEHNSSYAQHPMGLAATRLTQHCNLESSCCFEKRLEMNTLSILDDLPKNQTIIAQFKPAAAALLKVNTTKNNKHCVSLFSIFSSQPPESKNNNLHTAKIIRWTDE